MSIYTEALQLPYTSPIDPIEFLWKKPADFYFAPALNSIQDLVEAEHQHELHMASLEIRWAQEEEDSQPYFCEVEGKYEFPGFCLLLRLERTMADYHGEHLNRKWAELTGAAEGWV